MPVVDQLCRQLGQKGEEKDHRSLDHEPEAEQQSVAGRIAGVSAVP